MNNSKKRLLAAGVALAAALANAGALADAAGISEYEYESSEFYAPAPKTKLSTAPLRAGETDRYFSLNGAEDFTTYASHEDSIYRDGWQTLFADSDTITETTLSFSLADGLSLVGADGQTIASGVTPVSLSETGIDVKVKADENSDYEGERQYHLNVVPKASGKAELFVIGAGGRNVSFNSYSGSEYDIVLYNRGTLPLTGISVELVGAQNVALANADELQNITIEPVISTAGGMNAQPAAKLTATGSEGSIGGTLRITGADGGVLLEIPLSGQSGDPKLGSLSDGIAVKYVPFSDYLEIKDGFDWLNAEITVSGLTDGFTYDPATHELYGVPQSEGTESFSATVNFLTDDGTLFATKTESYALTVLSNTNENVYNSTDTGYEILKPIGDEHTGHDFVRTYHTYGRRNNTNNEERDQEWNHQENWDNQENWDEPNGDRYREALNGLTIVGGSAGAKYVLTDTEGNEIYSWVNEENEQEISIGSYLEPDTVYYINLSELPMGTAGGGDSWSTQNNGNAADFISESDGREVEPNGTIIIPDIEREIYDTYISTHRIRTQSVEELNRMYGRHDQPEPNYDEESFLADAIDVTDELFISKGEFAEFRKVWLNGRLLGSDEYTAVEGSTEITISAQTMRDSVVQGVNTLAAEFRTTDTHTNELKVSAQNFRVELVGAETSGTSNTTSTSGSYDFARTGNISFANSVSAAEGNAAPAAAPAAENNAAAGGAPAASGESSDDNAKSGSKTNYVLSGLLMLGALTALIMTRKEDI